MTRIERIADLRRKIAALPANDRKNRTVMETELRTLITRQVAWENKMDRKAARAA